MEDRFARMMEDEQERTKAKLKGERRKDKGLVFRGSEFRVQEYRQAVNSE